MKKILTLLVASTALTAVIGVPAWSAMRAPAGADAHPIVTVLDPDQDALPLVFVSDDDDDDDHECHRSSRYDDDDDDNDDDDDECRGARNPAPADTAAPPQNGLFGNGAPPQAQVK